MWYIRSFGNDWQWTNKTINILKVVKITLFFGNIVPLGFNNLGAMCLQLAQFVHQLFFRYQSKAPLHGLFHIFRALKLICFQNMLDCLGQEHVAEVQIWWIGALFDQLKPYCAQMILSYSSRMWFTKRCMSRILILFFLRVEKTLANVFQVLNHDVCINRLSLG